MNRTQKQTAADRIDLELARLANAAERDDLTGVSLAIRRARVATRGFMHPDDVAKTTGN